MSKPAVLTQKTLLIAVSELAEQDKRLARIVENHGPPPLWDREPGFPTLVRIILEQQVSLASAAALFAKFESHCGGPVTASRVTEVGEPGLLSIGFTRQKARYVVGLARQIDRGELSLDRIAQLHDDDARDALIGIPGVGPWTAGVYLLMALRRPDVWPPGDLGLHRSMAEVRGLKAVPTSDQAAAYARRWRPWRAVAARLLWHAYLARRAKTWSDAPATR